MYLLYQGGTTERVGSLLRNVHDLSIVKKDGLHRALISLSVAV